MAGDQDGAHGDAVAHDGIHQCRSGRIGIAVAEHDDVLEVGGGFLQAFMGQTHHAFKARQVALVHPGNLAAQLLLVAHLGHGKQPVLVAIPQHDAHFILRPQRLQHALRAIAGNLVAVGEFHAVHHQHHCAAGQHLFAVQFHVHRQRLFQRRAAIAARRVGLVAAHADQPHAKIPHRAFQQLLQIVAQVAGGQVADENRVVALHLRQRAGKSLSRHKLRFKAGGLQRGNQRFVRLRVGRDHQHSRLALHAGERAGPIVLRHGVPRRSTRTSYL